MNYKDLIRNRPDQVNINAAICKETSSLHYITSPNPFVRGFYEFMSQPFLKKWHREIYNNPSLVDNLPVINCYPLVSLLNLAHVNHVDLWILDVEGAEMSVLSGTDFSVFKPSVIMMECDNSERDSGKISLLKENGYSCKSAFRNCVCSHNDFSPSKSTSKKKYYNFPRTKIYEFNN